MKTDETIKENTKPCNKPINCPVCGHDITECGCWEHICPRISQGEDCPVCDKFFGTSEG